MLRSLKAGPLCAVLATAALALLPGAAFAQGAGDDQYADPFGDMPVEQQAAPPAGTETPPPSGDWNGGSDTAGTTEAVPVAAETDTTIEDSSTEDVAAAGTAQELPRTGLPAHLLALVGLTLLACGTLIHFAVLRFAPSSSYARAVGMGPLHTAPRPPGFEPLVARRRLRRSRR